MANNANVLDVIHCQMNKAMLTAANNPAIIHPRALAPDVHKPSVQTRSRLVGMPVQLAKSYNFNVDFPAEHGLYWYELCEASPSVKQAVVCDVPVNKTLSHKVMQLSLFPHSPPYAVTEAALAKASQPEVLCLIVNSPPVHVTSV